MAVKGTPHSPPNPGLEPHHQIIRGHISGHTSGKSYPSGEIQTANSKVVDNWASIKSVCDSIYLSVYGVPQYLCIHQAKSGDISTLDGTSLKLVDKFTYQGSSVSSTEKDIDTRLMKAWTAIDSLTIIWKSDLTDKMKRSFFQAVVVSILLYGCTTWTLTKRLEKKLDGNYTRMLRAILNKSRRQHPTRH